MKQGNQATSEDSGLPGASGRDEHIAPAPRVSVQAFCENVDTAAAIQAAGDDRRLAKAHLRIQMGGLTAAVEAYQSSPTPNVIILESEHRSDDILAGLDQLANYCDAGTRVVVIGRMNDVTLYRELVRRGFRFVGPTICYAFMQATGMVNDHVVGCAAGEEVRAAAQVDRAG